MSGGITIPLPPGCDWYYGSWDAIGLDEADIQIVSGPHPDLPVGGEER